MYDLTNMIGYEFFQATFAVVLCVLPFMVINYIIASVVFYVGYKGLLFLWNKKSAAGNVLGQGRGIFITGCDTGFGHDIAKHLDGLGFTVFAGCLYETSDGAKKLKLECSERLHVVKVDVTNDKHVENALIYVERFLPEKGLWGIVNNAGMNVIGEVELTPVSIYHKCMNLHLYGAIRVIQTFLPLLRRTKGRIVNLSSVRGKFSMPTWSIYESSKHAVGTMSDSLRLEMKKFGIKVSVILPGMFGECTAIHNDAMVKRELKDIDYMWDHASDAMKKAYTKDYLRSWVPPPIKSPEKQDARLIKIVPKGVEHALCTRSPHATYLLSGYGAYWRWLDEYALLARWYKQLPTWMMDKYIVWWTGCASMDVKSSF